MYVRQSANGHSSPRYPLIFSGIVGNVQDRHHIYCVAPLSCWQRGLLGEGRGDGVEREGKGRGVAYSLADGPQNEPRVSISGFANLDQS